MQSGISQPLYFLSHFASFVNKLINTTKMPLSLKPLNLRKVPKFDKSTYRHSILKNELRSFHSQTQRVSPLFFSKYTKTLYTHAHTYVHTYIYIKWML